MCEDKEVSFSRQIHPGPVNVASSIALIDCTDFPGVKVTLRGYLDMKIAMKHKRRLFLRFFFSF